MDDEHSGAISKNQRDDFPRQPCSIKSEPDIPSGFVVINERFFPALEPHANHFTGTRASLQS